MNLADMIKAAKNAGAEVSVSVSGVEAVKIYLEGDEVNVDILDVDGVSKLLAGLKEGGQEESE